MSATHGALPRCSTAEALYAVEHVKEAVVTLCQLAANHYPCMNTFVDVGSNKGHTGAIFFGLWAREASGIHGVSHWWQAAWNSSKGSCGYCKDCLEFERERPIGCSEDAAAGPHVIRVHSFDGSRSLVEHVRTSAVRLFPLVQHHWSVHWAVVSNRSGVATFGQQNGETDQIDGEANGQQGSDASSKNSAQVRMWTIDEFAQEHGLQTLDVLKIDAEGHDPMVLSGASETLRSRRVKLIYFEYGMFPSWVSIRLESVVALLERSGYACYLGGEVAMVRLTGCWRDEWDLFHPRTGLILGGNRALGVNVFCASLVNAPALADAFEASSLWPGRKLADCAGLCRPQVMTRYDRAKISHKTNVSIGLARMEVAARAGLPLPIFT